MPSLETRVIGILAGGGSLPREVAERVIAHGGAVHIVAITGEVDDSLRGLPVTRVGWGQIGGMLAALRGAGCTTLVIVGGPSGPDGPRELRSLHALAQQLGVAHRVRFVAPQPHRVLADFYRAADVCIVPSRTESFGLVALEAAACGTPVVACGAPAGG